MGTRVIESIFEPNGPFHHSECNEVVPFLIQNGADPGQSVVLLAVEHLETKTSGSLGTDMGDLVLKKILVFPGCCDAPP